MNKSALFTLAAAFAAFSANAQEDIDTGPDQAEAPVTIAPCHFQIEARFRYLVPGENGHEWSMPEVDFRYGLTPFVELHVTAEITDLRLQDSTANGLKPVKAGLKLKISEKKKSLMPETAVTARVAIPGLASRDFRADELAPEIGLLFRNEVGEKMQVDYNLYAKWDGESARTQFQYAVSPEFSLANDKLKVFAESYGFLYEHDRPEHWLDAGIMFLPNKDLQLELSGGYELTATENFHQYFGLAGFSFRI